MTSYHLFSWAPVLVILVIALLAGRSAWNSRRKEKENLRSIASTLGLTFSEPESGSTFMRMIGGWEMKGKYNGVPLRIYGKKVGEDDRTYESQFIEATADCRTKCGLMITRETTLGRIARTVLPLQDVTTGNPELDRRVVIKGVPTDVVKRIVDDERLQRELVKLFELPGMIHVDINGAHFRTSGGLPDAEELRNLLDSLTRTTRALEQATE